MSLEGMEMAVGKIDSSVMCHFTKDKDGLYYNERTEEEIIKRKEYSESRRKNRSRFNTSKSYESHMKNICETYDEHMENENVNVNVNKNREEIIDKNTTIITEIVNYLNEKASTSYRPKTKKTREHINARLSEGFSVDDFKTVIDKKCDEWIGTEFEKYLCPDTLFGTKFEKYLQSKINKQKKSSNNAGDNIFLQIAQEQGLL